MMMMLSVVTTHNDNDSAAAETNGYASLLWETFGYCWIEICLPFPMPDNYVYAVTMVIMM